MSKAKRNKLREQSMRNETKQSGGSSSAVISILHRCCSHMWRQTLIIQIEKQQQQHKKALGKHIGSRAIVCVAVLVRRESARALEAGRKITVYFQSSRSSVSRMLSPKSQV